MEIKHRKYYDNSEYYQKKATLKKPDGVHCIVCGGTLPKYKSRYCSDNCSYWWLDVGVKDWTHVREKAFERDKYSCIKCHKTLEQQHKETNFEKGLIADHIIPIAVGGEEFDIRNIQTLCQDCNKIKTREDSRRIAEFRKKIKQEQNGEDIMKSRHEMEKRWRQFYLNNF
jgi:hypothetical protein